MHATITTKTDQADPLETVSVIVGSLNGKLAIHESIQSSGYTLTHIPTGFAVCTRIVTLSDAEDLMLRLEDAANWNFRVPHSPIWKAQAPALYPIVREVQQHSY